MSIFIIQLNLNYIFKLTIFFWVSTFLLSVPLSWAKAYPSFAQIHPSCDIHIWQRGIYATESLSPELGGIIGSIVTSEYNRKYPEDTVEGLMEDALNIDALPAALKNVQWQSFTNISENNIIYQKEILSNADFKSIKRSKLRKTNSTNNCYAEIYIGRQTFSGSSIRSLLFSDLFVRTFYGSRFTAKGAVLWDQTDKVLVKDQDAQNKAKLAFSSSFATILNKFLQKKAPKPSLGL